ncbi:M24 family metallopeptidase [Paenibacillus lutrae]|uniref:M24 family metallopeptidase n=1 Tax=Paenibacillus lutrae TaxID=2078573 RepID=A0A7X3K216_9BACL|nr:Xaa-Pro peptidase family protein [Paenibacillus lutrae]MVP02496.1 M24 family metallopeptidase [Paenibacillus lutrae]
MNERLQQLTGYMEQNSLDAVIVTLPRHVYYLTGFASDPHERFLGLVLVNGQDPFLLVPALDEEAAVQASSVKRVYTHQDTDSAYEILQGLLPAGLNAVGIESEHWTLSRYEQLRGFVQAGRFTAVDEQLRNMRVIKTPEEVVLMRRAAEVVEEVLRRGLEKVKIGTAEIDIVAELEYQMKKLGAQGPSFSTMVLTGAASALPHGVPCSRTISRGDLLLFDLGVYLNGYASDITRTFIVGEASEEQRRIYETVLAGNRAGIEAVRPGATFASVDAAARSTIEEAGYGVYFNHRLGHGLGLDVHEYPSVHGRNEEVLRAGMTFTIEPGVYVQGTGGVRIEDEVLVTASGVDVLTSFPKDLTIISG